MIVSYSRDASLSVAISKTFDGLHPCKLCKFVQEKKHTNKDHPFDKQIKKIDLMVYQKEGLLDPPSVQVGIGFEPIAVTPPLKLPPTPPPKTA